MLAMAFGVYMVMKAPVILCKYVPREYWAAGLFSMGLLGMGAIIVFACLLSILSKRGQSEQ